ncbi:hypothetical protein [Vibrio mediterranei]|uniref:hypothetical protein n=1 Tax=Vibrio mediterranei TaxID=689 RepID=UPI0040691944
MRQIEFDKAYTGIGSRAITKYVSKEVITLAYVMAFNGFRHLGGGAPGIDMSFIFGAKVALKAMRSVGMRLSLGQLTTAYLPWNNFNAIEANQGWAWVPRDDQAKAIAKLHHLGWDNLSNAAKKLMTRNVHQIYGDKIDAQPLSQFVFAWTPDGAQETTTAKTGGTGQAIRIANACGISVRNLQRESVRHAMLDYVEAQLNQIDRKYGLDSRALIDFEIDTDKPGFASWIYGDIVEHFQSGHFDAVIHCANTQNKMGSGVAKSLTKAFPELYTVDRKKGKGSHLLGDFSVLNTQFGSIYNVYGQEFYGRDRDTLYVDYQKLHNGLKSVHQFTRKKKILIPMLGSGTANGCWVTISQILRHFPDWDLSIIRLSHSANR